MVNLRSFFEELKAVLSVSKEDISSRKKTKLVEIGLCYCVGYMSETSNLSIDDIAFLLGLTEQECEDAFQMHDSEYYCNKQYQKSFDIIIGRLLNYQVPDIIVVVDVCEKPERIPLFSTPNFYYETSGNQEVDSIGKPQPKRKLRT